MAALATALFVLAAVAYLVAAMVFTLDLRRPDDTGRTARWATTALALGIALHAADIVVESLVLGVCPVGSIHFGLSLLGLVVAATYLGVRSRLRVAALGALVAPSALGLLALGALSGADATRVGARPSSLLALHVTVSVLGTGLFVLAGVAGAVYLMEDWRLRHKRWVPTQARMPSLDALDATAFRLLLVGFGLLTLGLITAFLLPPAALDDFRRLRDVFAYATWALVGLVLALRSLAGWRGRRAAYGTLAALAGVLAVIVAYVVRVSEGGAP